jgi:arylsulfatase A-like enzyme
MNRIAKRLAKIFGKLLALGSLVIAHLSPAADLLPQSKPLFNGKIAVSAKDSIPGWPQPAKAPAGAPNIVLILLDDIGFADTSTFGGIAQTPELSKLAAQGLRYNNFNTAASCSPTRAALLAGRNHHRVGFGVAEAVGGFPGYNFMWKKDTAAIPEILRRGGYSTAAFGKWHNTAPWEISSIGPFDRWPTGLGFEYFYGFMGGKENQWEPSSLYRNTTPIEPPATPEQGYHLTSDLTNEAIRWLHTHESLAPEKPYFLYFATGAVHTPHQVPQEWIDKYRGQFDRGWDKLNEEIFARQKQLGVIPADAELTPRPKEVPAWASLSADQRKLYARQMEVYAGFIAHTDFEIGRLLEAVRQGSGGANTLILYVVGDNGACAEGGLNGFTDAITSVWEQLKDLDALGSPRVASNLYSAGWAWLGATPFKGWKWDASHFGGVRNPLIVSWPARIKDQGGLRRQFAHVNDVAATLYEVARIPFPAIVNGVQQQPLDGVSFAQTFDHPEASSGHRTQYFEMMGNRAIYQDGWLAAAPHWVLPWEPLNADRFMDFTHDRWELYHVEQDFSEARDLATQYPERLKELQALFDIEASRNDVYPLGAVMTSHTGEASLTEDKRVFAYHPGMPRIPRTAMPPLSGKSYRITARAVVPETEAQGVLLSYGGRESGFALYIQGNRLVYENNLRNGLHQVITSDLPVPRGADILAFEFTQESISKGNNVWVGDTSIGTGRLFINGHVVGQGKFTQALDFGYSRSLGIGEEFGSPVSEAFRPPFRFTGTLEEVKVELE